MNFWSLVRFAGALAGASILHASWAGAGTEKVIYSFKGGSDGENPEANLTAVNGTLYGTTSYGGKGCGGGCGTVFSVTPDGTETVLHAFMGLDGALPLGSLINVNGMLYGTTATGGGFTSCPYDTCGTVFSITPGGVETVLHRFTGGVDGGQPRDGLVNVNGTLYGTTVTGGSLSFGTVFSITPGGVETVLHAFGGRGDGGTPNADLINVNGTLYGTTAVGGTGRCGGGIVYSITPAGKETVIYSFNCGKDGNIPGAGLTAVNGLLYGTTVEGGGPSDCHGGCGTVYSVTPQGAETVLYRFTRSYGFPYAGLTDVGGTLFGTTPSNGRSVGTVYSITPDGTEKLQYSFKYIDGYDPHAGLINVNGTLYGTTPSGGQSGYGTVFSFKP